MNTNQKALELKSRIVSTAGSLKANFNAHNAKLLNDACAELLGLTGEVFAAGSFVKVA